MRRNESFPRDPWLVRLCRKIFAFALRVYPARFRGEFADEMQQVFANACRDVYHDRGVLGLMGLCVYTTFDLGITAMKEQISASPRNVLRSISLVIVILAMGFFIGWVDLHNNEPQPAAMCIVVFSFILGFRSPAKAWLWAILIGLSIPVSQSVALAKGTGSLHNLLTCVIAFIPAFIGGYSGALVRWGASSNNKTPHSGAPQV
jgi:hypothetical protein